MKQRRLLATLMFVFASLTAYSIAATLESTSPTTIADAAESKDWQLLSKLLAKGDDATIAQPDGMTALHWATFHGHEDGVRALLKTGAKSNVRTSYEVTPLSIACQQSKPNIARLLLENKADPNDELPGGVTPLMLAAQAGSPQTITALVERGAKVDQTERRGQTALMWAAAAGNLKAVNALLDAKAELNKTNKSAFNALLFAVREGRSDVVKRLIDSGADINAPMKPSRSGKRVPRDGSTALTLAIESGHFELAMFLIEKGADPNDIRSGYGPLHALSWVRKPNRGEEPDGDPPPRGSGNLTSLEFVRAIVAAGADVNLRLNKKKTGKAVLNTKGASPMLLASRTADIEYMKLLVELGADPTMTNDDGCNALMSCAGVGVRAVGEEAGTESEVLEAMKYLLSFDLDVNTIDKNKETAMHGAAYRCFPKAIAFLAEQGADPSRWDHKNKYGWTPTLIGKGHRPGSFKPHPPTVAAIEAAKELAADRAGELLLRRLPN